MCKPTSVSEVPPPPSPTSKLNAHNTALHRTVQPSTFSVSKEPEPHVIRRGQILARHPEIKDLYVPDPVWSPLFCIGTCAVQLLMAYLVSRFDFNWWITVALAWSIGGTMNHSLVLAMHELSHDLWFPKFKVDKFGMKFTFNPNPWFAFLINCPTCVASASTFKRYHLEHHSFQGSEKWDADIPTALEGRIFSSTLGKLLFVALQPIFYGFRPIIVKPKQITPMEIMNWVVVGSFDFAVVHFLGGKAIAYLFMGSILGLGLHPIAGHFIAEHFEFIEGIETYSYYGPLNALTYNVGYHNEHHDFPKVCGRLLPLVREICATGGVPKRTGKAGGVLGQFMGVGDWEVVKKDSKKASPQFYEDVPHYDSWTRVLLTFIFGKGMNGFCRVKRSP